MRTVSTIVIALAICSLSLQKDTDTPNTYNVENQWGGPFAPWNNGGVWVIGGRVDQRVEKLDIVSSDDGLTLEGIIQYVNEGPIGFKASNKVDNEWKVKEQSGSNSAAWRNGGTFVLGARANQPVVKLNIFSTDNGVMFAGTMTYRGEGPIGFRAALA
jgi:hypothetical protein